MFTGFFRVGNSPKVAVRVPFWDMQIKGDRSKWNRKEVSTATPLPPVLQSDIGSYHGEGLAFQDDHPFVIFAPRSFGRYSVPNRIPIAPLL
jgi:hypothetical protein